MEDVSPAKKVKKAKNTKVSPLDIVVWRVECRDVDRRDMNISTSFFETEDQAREYMVSSVIDAAKVFRDGTWTKLKYILAGMDTYYGCDEDGRDVYPFAVHFLKSIMERDLRPSDFKHDDTYYFIPSMYFHILKRYGMGTEWTISKWSPRQGISTDVDAGDMC
jgi:hypothetical protein